MDFMTLAKERFAVRNFKDTPIETQKLDLILEAAKVAPTAANNQPQKIYVLKSEAALKKIRSITKYAFNAPTVLMVAYDTEREWVNNLEPAVHSGQEDASIVATHMMLEAWTLGIASCWVNLFPNTETEKAFNLPENEKLVLLMPIGYAKDSAKPAARHTKYREQQDYVTEL